MKANFVLPSANFNIVLTREEIQEILDKGYICKTVNKDMPVTASWSTINKDEKCIEHVRVDRGVVPTVYIDDKKVVEDYGENNQAIQFLLIGVEKEDK